MLDKEWRDNIHRIHIDDLMLDFQNPRINTGENLSHEQIVQELFEEDVLDLAKRIAEMGYVAPVLLMVIYNEGKYTVIDGNRRTLAVKLLNNPEIIRNFVTRNKFLEIQKLSENALEKKISFLKAIVYPNRAKAEQDMALQHLDGVPLLQWKPLRQYRYFKSKIIEKNFNVNELAQELRVDSKSIRNGLITLQLYEIAKKELTLSNELHTKIFSNDKLFKTDKFRRLVVINTSGMRFLGYSFCEKTNKVCIDVNQTLFYQRLKKVLEEIYDPNSEYLQSAQFSTHDAQKFFESIDPNFLDKKTYNKRKKEQKEKDESKQEDFFSSQQSNGQSDNVEGETNSSSSGNAGFQHTSSSAGRSKSKPKGLFFPAEVPYRLENKQLQNLYRELRDISVQDFPNATHDLLRSFLECSLVEFLSVRGDYAKIQKHPGHNPKLFELLTYVINHKIFQDPHVCDNLEGIKVEWNKPYSLHRMNAVNHNKNYSSTEKDARSAWERIEPLFKIILNPKFKN